MFALDDKKTVYLYGMAAFMCYLIINQGGYFDGGIVLAGIILSVLLLRKKLEVKVFEFVFLAFSLWYLFCSVRAGFDISCVAKGSVPLVMLMFRWVLPKDAETSRELCKKVIKVSFYITLIAVLWCGLSSVHFKALTRLKFPFQYANASGAFFGVMFILSRYMGFEWAKKRQYVFLVALLLTQSVGAVGVTLIAEVCLNPHKIRTFIMLAILGIGGVFFWSRIYQSMGTFLERFVQIRDGFVCMLQNPFFGIGAGKWLTQKDLYQSGIYVAREIHCSLMQVGVASGVLGFLLLIFSFVTLFKKIKFENKAYLAGVLILIGHSLLDFSFSFLALGCLLMLLLACGETKEDEKELVAGKPVYIPVFSIILVGFVLLSNGLSQIKRLDGYHYANNHIRFIEYYESHILARQDVEATEDYARAWFELGEHERCLEVLDGMGVLSSNMVALEFKCTNDWKGVLKHIEQQPYNTVLYRRVYYNCDDEELKKETKKRFREALDAMSFLGKTLYHFIGDEII